jgi:hypothetical protein
MKYIFLDIDGVLATNKEFLRNTKKFQEKNEWAKNLRVPYPWNPGTVKVFNEILTETDAEIILSSDWKKHWTLEQLDVIFKANGVNKSPIDVTHNKPISMAWMERNRMSDIESYLFENNFVDHTEGDKATCAWIIIDDLNIRQWLPEDLKDRFFLTRSEQGIKETGLKEKIIKKLNEL